MEQNRRISIILADLGLDILKAQEKIEVAINKVGPIQLSEIKVALNDMVLAELAIEKFKALLDAPAPPKTNG